MIRTGRAAILHAHENATNTVLCAHLERCRQCRDATTGKERCTQGAAAFEEWHIAKNRLTGDRT